MKPRQLLPTIGAICAVVTACVLAVSETTFQFRGFTAESLRRMRVAAEPVSLEPVEVVSSLNENLTLWSSDAAVDVWVVTFFYSRCNTLCLAAGTEMQQLQAQLKAGERIKLVSLSFDGKHDKPEVLANYARRMRSDPQRWLVASVTSSSALERLLRRARVVVIDDGVGGLAHNAAIHVVTSSGQLTGLFGINQPLEALGLARSLAE